MHDYLALLAAPPAAEASPEIAEELNALKPFEDGSTNAVADELGVRRGS